ncbi:unnamed protein product [Closterium sp. Yama58-4]|nr:unnamed protein product [Closterium sp. Yama58-4]
MPNKGGLRNHRQAVLCLPLVAPVAVKRRQKDFLKLPAMAVHRGSSRGLLALVAAIACFCCLPRTSLAQPIAESQGEVLQELQTSWSLNFGGWQAGSDCTQAQGLTCDSDGMITSMRFNTSLVVYFPLPSVTRLSRLTQLEFSQVDHIPWGSLYNITWLESLVVDCLPSMTNSIPDGVANLTQLTRLRISDCGFENQLNRLSRLSHLSELEVPSNGITSMWDISPTNFPTLVKLNLSSNPLRTYDLIKNLPRLSGLTTLDLSSNQLEGDKVLPNITLPTLQFFAIAPAIAPVIAPAIAPVIAPAIAPVIAPAIAPVIAPAIAPVIAPAIAPVIAPAPVSLYADHHMHLSTLDTNSSGLTCPGSYTSCGVPQNASSAFCRTCPDFCATCDKRKPLPWWAIAGIVAGVVLIVALAVLLYFYCFTNRASRTVPPHTALPLLLAWHSTNKSCGCPRSKSPHCLYDCPSTSIHPLPCWSLCHQFLASPLALMRILKSFLCSLAGHQWVSQMDFQ